MANQDNLGLFTWDQNENEKNALKAEFDNCRVQSKPQEKVLIIHDQSFEQKNEHEACTKHK